MILYKRNCQNCQKNQIHPQYWTETPIQNEFWDFQWTILGKLSDFSKSKIFREKFFEISTSKNIFSRIFENRNVKRLSQKIPNSPSIENPSEYGELVDKSLELQYEQERFIKCKITILSLFWWFVIFEHVRTCLLLTVLVTLPIHVFKMP